MIKGQYLIGKQVEIQTKLFIVERLIAEGGFGFVYQVCDSNQRGNKFALK